MPDHKRGIVQVALALDQAHIAHNNHWAKDVHDTAPLNGHHKLLATANGKLCSVLHVCNGIVGGQGADPTSHRSI